MQRISITNPQNIIDGTAKKYYFKLRNTGGPKGDKGDKGDTGQTGPQGPKGDAATVAVGSTTTLAVGQNATVENVGSIYNAVLNFGIPQGPQGPQGAKGDKGDTGAQGETGPRGPQGERGTNATVNIGTTTTTNPGTQARVYNSGTDSNAVLNFEIPRGDVGPMPTIAQTTGQSTTEVMSQKATTDALNTKQATITSSNKLSADLVTDTTTTNKFVTAEDKTTWNAKQNALTAGQGIDITSDVISTPALVPEVVASLPAEGAESKLYLTPKAHTSQTATGNPITASVTEQAGALESFQLDGDTYQQTYTGKNLLNAPDYAATAGTMTCITSDSNNFSCSGTVSETWGFNIVASRTTISPIPAGDYVFSLSKALSFPVSFQFRVTSSGGAIGGRKTIPAGSTSVTFTLSETVNIFTFWSTESQNTQINDTFAVQIEAGSTATSYEPYVGGTASPNPDYPQPIQTVTGEQTVMVVGKNLFDPKQAYAQGVRMQNIRFQIPVTEGQTYTFSITNSRTYASIRPLNSGGSQTRVIGNTASDYVVSFTASSGEVAARFDFYSGQDNVDVATYDFSGIQIELGSTATAYAPYSEQTLPLDLGTIELCKLGTYQDYIWKDGEDWKVHKATGSYKCTGQENWVRSGNTTQTVFVASLADFNNLLPSNATQQARAALLSDLFIRNNVLGGASGRFDIYNGGAVLGLSFDIVDIPDITTTKAWIKTNKPIVYAPLATATDTTITDQTLIAQLEAIRTASLQNGTNTITNTAAGSNLAGDMEVGYYGYNPRNRYDKWLWLDINNEYEQIGS